MKVFDNKSLFWLFYKLELKTLLGKNNSNLFILVIMLFITFTAIGFAKGSLNYLEYKMKDPFINWIDVLPGIRSDGNISAIINELNTDEVKTAYNLDNAIGYNRFHINFYDYDNILDYYSTAQLDTNRIAGFPARTLDIDDTVINEIFAPNNVVTGRPYYDQMDIGLLVTRELLQRLNYPMNTPFVWIDFPAIDPSDWNRQVRIAIPVPVRAVLHTLPGLARFASTSHFFQQRFVSANNPFNVLNENRFVMAFHGSANEAAQLAKKTERYINQPHVSQSFQVNSIWSEPWLANEQHGLHLVYVTFTPRNIPYRKINQIFHNIYNHDDFAPYHGKLYRMYDYERALTAVRPMRNYDRIALNFSNLDKLREFSAMLIDSYNLEIDMAQIESRENYNFVSRLTAIISFVLVAFSISSVLLFVVHLLKKHLQSIKRNLGTFKAFGVPNKFLLRIYERIALTILAMATAIALVVSALFGYLGGIRQLLILFGSKMEPGRYYELMSNYLLIAIFMFVVCSIFVIQFVIRVILNHTPGNLIYERK